MAYSSDQPYRHLGVCRYCKRDLNQPFCEFVDPEYHQSWRNTMVAAALSRIQDDIDLVQFLQKCETDHVYAKEGHESPFNEPTY